MGPSAQQMLIVLLIVVLLFGAKKIPELAKGIGKGIKSFKKEIESDDEEEVIEAKKVEEPKEKKETQAEVKTSETTKEA